MRKRYPILEFDPQREAVIEPAKILKPIDAPERCVVCFFPEVIARLYEDGRARILFTLKSEIGPHPLYELDLDGQRILPRIIVPVQLVRLVVDRQS